MKRLTFALIVLLSFVSLVSQAQPYVVGEQTEKVFSEDFSDATNSFPTTNSQDPKFWGQYGDGYYYMERKIERPRVVIANFKGLSRDFYLKTKLQLGPVKSREQSVGVFFLAQPGGRGGFVFEINKKKEFRVKDLGSNAYISKEGDEGWIKSKSIYGAQRNNRIEIKGFRGGFDIYVNDTYIYSFQNKSYKNGSFGAYIGGNTQAKMIYFNLYELTIPGAGEEIIPENLQATIKRLKAENDSLRTVALETKFGGSNKAAISAIKILEDQVAASREENLNLKKIIKEYEENEPVQDPAASASQSEEVVNKVNQLTNERDSLEERCETLEKKIEFMESHIEEVKNEIKKINTTESATNTEQSPDLELPASAPSQVPVIEKPLTQAATDSTYEVTIDLDVADDQETAEGLIEEETVEEKPQLVPLKEQNIPIKKAKKGLFKD